MSSAAAAPAAAQICTGHSSFANGSTKVLGSIAIGSGATAFGGGVRLGSTGVFGSAAVGVTSYDNDGGSSVDVGGSVGYQVPIRGGRPAQFCPIVSIGFGFGPNDVASTGIDFSSRSIALGGAFGIELGSQPNFRVVPSVALAVVNSRVTIKEGGESLSGSDGYGALTGAAGLIFNGRVSLVPFVTLPIGLDGSDPSFGVAASIAVGRRR